MANHTLKLAEFCSEITFAQLEPKVVERAKLIISDCVAAILGGSVETEVQQLLKLRCGRKSTIRQVPIIGLSKWAERSQAALLHGLAGTVLEMDEGHQFAKGHPGMHVFPALLAAAQSDLPQQPVSGQDFITAFVAGYDVAARIGLASQLRPPMHPHGTWGVIGAASAIGRLLQFNNQQHAQLMNIASSLTTATSRKTMLEGGTVRNVYAGLSNQMAHLAIDLIQSGFSGEKDGIGSVFGQIVSEKLDWPLLLEHLGQRFEVMRNYFKLHACCRFNHAALDCLFELMHQHPQLSEVENIASIEVESYSLAAELNDSNPQNMLAAKFSLPFAIATTLVHKHSKVMSFAGDALKNESTLMLAQKVTVTENLSMTKMLPDFRPAKVTIKLKNAQILSHSVTTNKGDWQDPYCAQDLEEKFYSLAERTINRNKSDLLYNRLMALEKSKDIRDLFHRI